MKILTLTIAFLLSCSAMASLPSDYVVVPNRSDSSITLLSTPEGKILKTITAQETGFEFEPIYASTLPRFKMVAVSDRKNSQLLFFDNESFQYLGAVPASQGMFHMWPTPEQKEIFVVADIDRVVNAIEINRFGDKVVFKKRQIDTGQEFATGQPHDVVVDDQYVFVTMMGVEEVPGSKLDWVLQYDRKTLKLVNKLCFSFDIHLGIPSLSPYLLVVEQTAGQLNYIDKKTLQVVTSVENLPGAHGIFWNPDASRVYLANFLSKGPMALYEVRQTSGSGEFMAESLAAADLPDAKAHNITVDFKNQTLFVTHSGPNNDGALNTHVSIFSIKGDLKFEKSVQTGMNPLGILLVHR